MAEVIQMPRMSDTMEEGVIVEWHKKVGDVIKPGDLLAEVETDKATMELESYQEGTILYIGVEAGSAVPVEGVLAIIGEAGEDYKPLLEEATAKANAAKETVADEPAASASIEAASSKPAAAALPLPALSAATAPGNGRVKISPLARRLASESNININTLNGSGEDGRIIKRDIVAYLANPSVATNNLAAETDVALPITC